MFHPLSAEEDTISGKALDIPRVVICGVYVAICTATGEMYVGSSRDCRQRWRQHRALLRGRRSPCRALQSAWDQHPEKLSFAVLLECGQDELLYHEQRYIDWLQPALNTVGTAGTSLGHKMSPEVRERLKQRPQSRAELHKFEGEMLPVPEIARRLGVTPAGVYARIRAGRSAAPRRQKDRTAPIDIGGRLLTIKEISEEFALPLTTVYSRLRLGWTGADLVAPRKRRGRNS